MTWMDGDADWVEPVEQVENLKLVGEDVWHWGVWHPKEGWRQNVMGVFVTINKAIAEVEADAVRRWKTDDWDPSLWEVRCIEEWVDD